MTTVIRRCILLASFACASRSHAYADLSPDQAHARLIQGDSLILLDVRENSEYRNGHIAEPRGQLPLTPANMPWNSGVLSAEYSRLPHEIDILVYCGSGRRSAAASLFLESKGFTRIFNMTGGFSSWPYESRSGDYGDHSGQWIGPSDSVPVVIVCAAAADSSTLVFPPKALPSGDSLYIELHPASSMSQAPLKVPRTELDGVFRITVLNRFGMTVMNGDSLTLSDTTSLRFFPNTTPSQNPSRLVDPSLSVYTPDQGWKSASCLVDGFSFNRGETVLRRWYALQGSFSTAVQGQARFMNHDIRLYPNPFNGSIRFNAPPGGIIRVFDSEGRIVETLCSNEWIPGQTTGSGVYFIQFAFPNHFATKKAVYIK